MRRSSAAVLSAVVLASLVATSGALAWTWPTEGPVLRPFSVGPDPYAGGQHRGVDIGAEIGRTVLAPAGGTVSFVGSVPGGGRAVTIATDDGYAVTLLQLGATSVARGSAVAEGAEVGVVGGSSDAVTLQPHVHLGVRVAADPNGYVDPLGLLPAPPAVVPPAPVEAPAPAPAVPVAIAPPPEIGETEAPAETPFPPEPPLASPSGADAGSLDVHPSARPVAVKRTAPRPIARHAVASASAASRSTKASGAVAARASRPAIAKRTRVATEVSSPARPAPRRPDRTSAATDAARSVLSVRRPLEVLPKPTPGPRAVFDRFADATARASEQSGGGDARDGRPALLAIAATVLLGLGTLLGRRRYRGTQGAPEDARMMNRDEHSARTPEDPRRGRVAVCERPTTHRPRGGIRGSGGHLRPLPPDARKRRPDGQRDGRARHAGHGRRGPSRRLAA
jgi:hypothetical protein